MLNEEENIDSLLRVLSAQQYKNSEVIICVNHPEFWRSLPGKKVIIASNERSLDLLHKATHQVDFPLHIIDHASPGKGWKPNHEGVGMARRMAMEKASAMATDNDLIVCMDADTEYPPGYFSSLVEAFDAIPRAQALCSPYYHRLTGNEINDRAILRYEIYMRHYVLNLVRIGSPYAYTPIGSSMASTARAYRRIRGMAPRKSGEDFYFIMQLRKTGIVIPWANTRTVPSSRPSERVIFGTGPAIIKGMQGNWNSYPIYDYRLFDRIGDIYASFQNARHDWPESIEAVFPGTGIEKLRRNNPDGGRLLHALHEKADGLRILQFLKDSQPDISDEDSLMIWDRTHGHLGLPDIDFDHSPIGELNRVRDQLMEAEEAVHSETYTHLKQTAPKDLLWKYMK